LTALALPDGIPGNNHRAADYKSLAKRLIVEFPIRCMPGGHQHRRVFARMIIWNIHERRDIQSRQTLENKFLNGVAVHGNLADDYWVQIGLCNGQTTNHFDELLPKLILRLQQARFVADGLPGFLAGLVSLPRLVGLLSPVRAAALVAWDRLHSE